MMTARRTRRRRSRARATRSRSCPSCHLKALQSRFISSIVVSRARALCWTWREDETRKSHRRDSSGAVSISPPAMSLASQYKGRSLIASIGDEVRCCRAAGLSTVLTLPGLDHGDPPRGHGAHRPQGQEELSGGRLEYVVGHAGAGACGAAR